MSEITELVSGRYIETNTRFPPFSLFLNYDIICNDIGNTHPKVIEALRSIFEAIVYRLPENYMGGIQELLRQRDEFYSGSGPTVPLYCVIDPAKVIIEILYQFYHEIGDDGYEIRKKLQDNENTIFGLSQYARRQKGVPLPTSVDKEPSDLAWAYLKETPFELLFNTQVPFRIPRETQFAHTWVCAGSGHGKTTALTSMIFEHIPEVIAGKASVVLIDSQNVIIPALERLKVWQGTNRLIVVDPDDPVALSLFDVDSSSINNALEMINFVFAKLSETELTYRQSNLFDYLGEFLITAVPNATIFDFRNMLDLKRAKDYAQYYPGASREVQDYLTTDFIKEKFTVDARSQVLTKMRAMLRMPAFANMFGSARTKFDLFNELERGTCVLIKPSKYAMGDDGTRLFGRFWIAQMKMVAQQRQRTSKKTPTYFYIDECQDYLRGGDPKIETILEQARKEHIGLTLLHHYGDQLKSNELLQLLGANTATKLCGSPASSDLSRFSSYMQCKPEFLLEQQPRKTFAMFVRGQTPRALSVKFPYIDLSKQPRLTEGEWRAMRDANRTRYGIDHPITNHAGQQRGDTENGPPSQPAHDISAPKKPRPVQPAPITNDLDANGRIDRALRMLTTHLQTMIERELKNAHPDTWQTRISYAQGAVPGQPLDPYGALKTLLDNWQSCFKNTLSNKTRYDISRALDGRNAVSHAFGEIPKADAVSYLVAIRDIAAAISADQIVTAINGFVDDQMDASTTPTRPATPPASRAVTADDDHIRPVSE